MRLTLVTLLVSGLAYANASGAIGYSGAPGTGSCNDCHSGGPMPSITLSGPDSPTGRIFLAPRLIAPKAASTSATPAVLSQKPPDAVEAPIDLRKPASYTTKRWRSAVACWGRSTRTRCHR